jgi:hypothetical protein
VQIFVSNHLIPEEFEFSALDDPCYVSQDEEVRSELRSHPAFEHVDWMRIWRLRHRLSNQPRASFDYWLSTDRMRHSGFVAGAGHCWLGGAAAHCGHPRGPHRNCEPRCLNVMLLRLYTKPMRSLLALCTC